MAAKLGMFAAVLLAVVLLAGIFGGDKSVHDLGDALATTVHWVGHWIGKIGHWIGETWQSFFDKDDKSAALGL